MNEIPQLQEAFDKMFVVHEGCIAAKCVKIIFSFLGPLGQCLGIGIEVELRIAFLHLDNVSKSIPLL